MKLVEIPPGIAFPPAALAVQITRTRGSFTRGRASRETVYAVTDLTYDDTTTAKLADAICGHWSIENRLQRIRDVTFAEDHSQVRTGHGHRSWPRSTISPSASAAYTEPPTSLPPAGRSAATQTVSCPSSDNSSNAETCRQW